MKTLSFGQEISTAIYRYQPLFISFCLALTFSPVLLVAQFAETINSGRPGQSIGAFTAGKGIFQAQSGFDQTNSSNSEISLKSEGILNNTVIRYGLSANLEISSMLEYKTERVASQGTITHLSGMSALDVGFRYHLFTGHGLTPNLGFQARARIPASEGDYGTDAIAPRFILVTSQQLSKTFKLITNTGASWNGDGSPATGTYTVNLSFPFSKRLGGFAEVYGTLQQSTFASNYDAGLAYLVTKDLQLDFSSGYGHNQGLRSYFFSTGISWRSKRKV